MPALQPLPSFCWRVLTGEELVRPANVWFTDVRYDSLLWGTRWVRFMASNRSETHGERPRLICVFWLLTQSVCPGLLLGGSLCKNLERVVLLLTRGSVLCEILHRWFVSAGKIFFDGSKSNHNVFLTALMESFKCYTNSVNLPECIIFHGYLSNTPQFCNWFFFQQINFTFHFSIVSFRLYL